MLICTGQSLLACPQQIRPAQGPVPAPPAGRAALPVSFQRKGWECPHSRIRLFQSEPSVLVTIATGVVGPLKKSLLRKPLFLCGNQISFSTQLCLETPHWSFPRLPPSSAHSTGEGAVTLSPQARELLQPVVSAISAVFALD